jgi:ketosteroid isomerase-like protein
MSHNGLMLYYFKKDKKFPRFTIKQKMKTLLLIIPIILFAIGCRHSKSKEAIKDEIFKTEKAFEKMTTEKGIAEAFYYFADEDAVIKRESDTLISGKENIRIYYEKKGLKDATVNWTPDFIDVSNSGDIGYTYGKYLWKIIDKDGNIVEYKGIFHTVWKRQNDNSWKYVWD